MLVRYAALMQRGSLGALWLGGLWPGALWLGTVSSLLAVPPGESPPARPAAPAADAVKIRPAQGLDASLWAREPLVRDPVAIAFDELGRLHIAESARQERGVEDNRSSSFWLLDDLRSESIEDRLAMYERWASKREGGMDFYRRYDDRVSRVEDSDGDGRGDRRVVFAGPFNEPLDGTGAGVLAIDGDVWYTNIPHLWRLRDEDGDGVAERKDAVWTGFGVRVALRGHDMHGLTLGPDGKLYWSIGDRGYRVALPDGTVFADPRSGAVFRCRLDGSGLELFCTGLRNPQELAFDEFGNLFTGDNNSDAGDKARIVYCMEGGETGWSMDYQTLDGANSRGPWNQEEIWALRPELVADRSIEASKVQPAWTLPPLAHVSSGPSGLVAYPGLGLSDRYRGAFFLCDFLGGDAYSRVLAFRLEPAGAGFRVVDVHPFVENVLPTDVDFGYDGRMYVSEWGGGWYSTDAGAVYAVWDPKYIDDPRIAEVGRLFREGFRHRGADELVVLLGHLDRRVRQRAQFALAERGPAMVARLADVAASGADRMARIHAIWALGQIADDGVLPAAAASLVARLDDRDAEVRAQAAKVLGEARLVAASGALMRALGDESLRVRASAAMSLGRLRAREAHAPIVAMLAENDGRDVFLRHAGVLALARLGERDATLLLATEPQTELRLCATLVLRRWRDPAIERMLSDSDDRVVAEAARAINDLPIPEARAGLLRLAERFRPAESGSADAAPIFTRERWTEVADSMASKLVDDPRFATTPNETDESAAFEARPDSGNRYLQRIRGVIAPPVSGPYVFSIASDDHSVLLLSPDERPEGLVPIARVAGYVDRGAWSSQQGQTSEPVMLEAGRRYWIEARHAEGGGGDHLAVGWRLPDGSVERPIGSGMFPPLASPIVRRIVNACVMTDDPTAAATLADLARSSSVPEGLRTEAMAALAEWMQPGPRDRVNGAYRAIDATGRDADAYRTVLRQKLPGLASFGSAPVRAAARDLAVVHGIALDGAVNLAVVLDPTQPVADRVGCLRQLCVDGDARAAEAIAAALASEEPLLRAEARLRLAIADPVRGASALEEALTRSDREERRRAVAALGVVPGSASETVLTELVRRLEAGEIEPALSLDVVRAAERRGEGPLPARVAAWMERVEDRGSDALFALALEGGDAASGRAIVEQHPSATCLKCHAIGGFGGDAAPTLDGIGGRVDRRSILRSLVDPGAEIAEGYGDASAMPSMATILTLDELRDVIEYLTSLR